ncbi:MAG: hypothetical protein LUD72_05370 [Bacteroidales bacterium]|nr:hypothetical protein [Bacteroidales bacterium]
MDKDLIKKYGLEEDLKRFQQINEYTFITSPMISEEGDDDPEQQGQGQQGQMPQGGMGQDAPQGMDMPQGQNQGVPQGMPQGQGQGTPQEQGQGMPQGDMPPMGGMEQNMGGEFGNFDTLQPDDEVIDVDYLTQSQEETEAKVDDVNTQIGRLINVISKFSDALEDSDRKIEDLKAEIERRNPTPEERLNIRSQTSFPYCEPPKNFWKHKMADNPNYNIMFDNDVSTADEQKAFDIRKSDIDNDFNYKEIADSFDDVPTLEDMLR